MTRGTASRTDRLLIWLGTRSRREKVLLLLVWMTILAYLLGQGLVLESSRNLQRERVRLQAARTSLGALEELVERRGEIMARAEGLVRDYLDSRQVESSALLLDRVERSRGGRTALESMYPVSRSTADRGEQFRVELTGAPADLGQLFYALSQGAPPIVLDDLALSAESGVEGHLTATAILEVVQRAIPDEWAGYFAKWSEPQGPGASPATGARVPPQAPSPRAPSPQAPSPQAASPRAIPANSPFKEIGRSGVFKSTPQQATGHLNAAAPSIQGLLDGLQLAGVIWKASPVAIIADRSTGQTFYREKGQFIEELEVVEITRSAVTLRYKDEEGRLE